MAEGFSGRQAAEIVGITYRQLDYWARTDLLRPSAADAQGSGSRRVYTYRDLLELKVIKDMLDAGIKLGSVRDVFDYLRRQLDADIASAHLVVSGGSVVLCNGEELLDVVRNGANRIAVALGADAATVTEGVEWFVTDASGDLVVGVPAPLT